MTIITREFKMEKSSILENKMRLIGYYNKPNQSMHEETEFVEEAACLAERLKISFDSLRNNSLTDAIFKSLLNSNAVFILKDRDNNLYAYFPCNNIARISNVVYNKKSVVPIPLKYKSWFVAGENIAINEKEGKRYIVTTSGSDFLITDSRKSKTLALNWDEDTYISVKELTNLINDEWVSLIEYETECNDCDGYDYSACDMSRCKNDCEHCGGRRNICNYSCFVKRHDTAFDYRMNENAIKEDLSELFDMLSIIAQPHTEHAALFNQYKSVFEEAYKHCEYMSEYFDISESLVGKFMREMDCCIMLNEGRNNYSDSTETLSIYIDYRKDKCIQRNALEYKSRGFLFWKSYHLLSRRTYDYITDSIIEFDYELKFDTEELRKEFQRGFPDISAIFIEKQEENNSLLVKRFH